MAWIVENRRTMVVEKGEQPYLTDDMKIDIANKYFPRYPTRRAVLLPTLHYVQHAYGWISTQAMEEIAAFLEISPAEVMDTATFYEEYWLKPKGKYLVQVCRSLACEICQSTALTEQMRKRLGVEVGETSADGRFTLVELECLGACGTAPVALINEVLHENLTPETLDQLIAQLPEDPHDYHDPTITWAEDDAHGAGPSALHGSSSTGGVDQGRGAHQTKPQ
jgi:NADH-quinone oxidoreductase E subunit